MFAMAFGRSIHFYFSTKMTCAHRLHAKLIIITPKLDFRCRTFKFCDVMWRKEQFIQKPIRPTHDERVLTGKYSYECIGIARIESFTWNKLNHIKMVLITKCFFRFKTMEPTDIYEIVVWKICNVCTATVILLLFKLKNDITNIIVVLYLHKKKEPNQENMYSNFSVKDS